MTNVIGEMCGCPVCCGVNYLIPKNATQNISQLCATLHTEHTTFKAVAARVFIKNDEYIRMALDGGSDDTAIERAMAALVIEYEDAKHTYMMAKITVSNASSIYQIA